MNNLINMGSIDNIVKDLSDPRTSIQIYRSTRIELTKIQGEIQAQNGKKRNYDEVIKELIKLWREHH